MTNTLYIACRESETIVKKIELLTVLHKMQGMCMEYFAGCTRLRQWCKILLL